MCLNYQVYFLNFKKLIIFFNIQAAFNGNTLGLPKLCPAENIDMLSQKVLKHFIQRYYRPERITIAGVNVDHDELVKHCEKFFVDAQPSWLSDQIAAPDMSIAQYVGGMLKVN